MSNKDYDCIFGHEISFEQHFCIIKLKEDYTKEYVDYVCKKHFLENICPELGNRLVAKHLGGKK